MKHWISISIIIVVLLLIVGCGDDAATAPQPTRAVPIETDGSGISATEEPPASAILPEPTEIPPTPTPVEPLAAVVNDHPIFLVDFERELARFEQAQSELGLIIEEGPSGPEIVLDALIEKELIAQAAEEMGITITPEMVDQRILELEEVTGGPQEFDSWLKANQWSIEEFKLALRAELITERAVELVTEDVPTAVEQVQASYLQVDDLTLAESLLEQIKAGADFGDLAREHSLDRLTGDNGGDLGYFAPGSLLVPEVEAAAFLLVPGETSEVITASKSDGEGTIYYIVQVTNRDLERRLNADLRFEMLQEKFQTWLEEQWLHAQITRYVEPNG